MKLGRRDYLTIAVPLVLIALLSLGELKGEGKKVPRDQRHFSVYDSLKQGRSRSDTEFGCITCHCESSYPLPPGHPPKEQCLLCHKLAK